MSSDADVTAMGRGGASANVADADLVRRLTRLGTGSCVRILDQVMRAADAGSVCDVATLARRITRATRDFRTAAAEISQGF
jgi:hypothetical protein